MAFNSINSIGIFFRCFMRKIKHKMIKRFVSFPYLLRLADNIIYLKLFLAQYVG